MPNMAPHAEQLPLPRSLSTYVARLLVLLYFSGAGFGLYFLLGTWWVFLVVMGVLLVALPMLMFVFWLSFHYVDDLRLLPLRALLQICSRWKW